MPILHIDTETASELDISEVGAYKYVSHPSTFLLLVAYAFGDEEVKLWECHKGKIPKDLEDALLDDLQIICAFNSQFERLVFKHLLGINVPVGRFEDTMIRARYMSIPGGLEKVGRIMEIRSQKLTEFFIKDQSMVELFCSPLRMGGEITLFGEEPTTYRDHTTHPKEWKKFCEYCIVDVEASRELLKRFSEFPLPEFEYELFELNEEINDCGIYTDSVLLQGASLVVDKEQAALNKEFFELTGIIKPKSNPAVLRYARANGYTFQSIGKPFVKRALAGECSLTPEGRRALELRLQLGKSSVSKLDAIRNSVQEDGRIRGMFNFMGAARTARWTSSIVQLQNLIKATKELEEKQSLALELLKAGDYGRIKKEFTSPLDVACSAIRPILRAPEGSTFFIADLSAIEARGAGWVSGCEGLLNVFRDNRDPYLAFAAQMDPSRSYEELYAEYEAGNKQARKYAKSPTLGCGYGLTAGAIEYDTDGNIVKTGLLGYAENLGVDLPIEYAEKAVQVYRNSYPEVVDFWWDLHRAYANVVEHDAVVELGPLCLYKKGRVLCILLPSGRELHYINPRVVWVEAVSKKGNKYKRVELFCMGVHPDTHQWCEIPTRGAKLFENVVQGLCRDILGCGMISARDEGFKLVLSCHDELVAEEKEDSSRTVQDLINCMTQPISWAPGFIMGAAGFSSPYYVKE